MHYYNFKKRSFTSGPHLLGLLLFAAGVFTLASPAFINSPGSLTKTLAVGAAAMAIGGITLSSYSGTIIDFKQKRVKAYMAVLGYKFGEWAVLPEISRIAVVPFQYTASNTPNGISPTWSGKGTDYRVFLYAEQPKPIVTFVFPDSARATKAARLLSENLRASYELKER